MKDCIAGFVVALVLGLVYGSVALLVLVAVLPWLN